VGSTIRAQRRLVDYTPRSAVRILPEPSAAAWGLAAPRGLAPMDPQFDFPDRDLDAAGVVSAKHGRIALLLVKKPLNQSHQRRFALRQTYF